MKKLNSYITVAKVNFKYTTWISYMIAIICMVAIIVDLIIDRILGTVGKTSVSIYCMSYIVCIMAPIFIASVNYNKLLNIGVKKKQYFYGCIINYIIFAAIISLFGVLENYLIDTALNSNGNTIHGLIRVFGWDSNIFTAFFSQFAFLLLVESIIHTLSFIQTKWYGWFADGIIIIIISVFTPIPALRTIEELFFNITIFATPFIQIPVCLALATLVYASNLFYLKKRV